MPTSRSRQFRNPRYAPEGLERKLSPSSLINGAYYAAADGGKTDNPMPTPPEPGTGLPPLLPTNPPGGPAGPA